MQTPLIIATRESRLALWQAEHVRAELVRRFDRAPKPMYYQPDFLRAAWADYQNTQGVTEDQVDPDAFVRWTYARALAHRTPRYAAMARNWGVSVTAEEIAAATTASAFIDLIATAIDRAPPRP